MHRISQQPSVAPPDYEELPGDTLQSLPSLRQHRNSLPDDVHNRYKKYNAVKGDFINLSPRSPYIPRGTWRNDSKGDTSSGDLHVFINRVACNDKYRNYRLEIDAPCMCCRYANNNAYVETARPCYEIFNCLYSKLGISKEERKFVALLKPKTNEIFVGQAQWKWDNLCRDGEREFIAIYKKRIRKKMEYNGSLFHSFMHRYWPDRFLKGRVAKDASLCAEEMDLDQYVVHGNIVDLWEPEELV